jgi:hypothetical protein
MASGDTEMPPPHPPPPPPKSKNNNKKKCKKKNEGGGGGGGGGEGWVSNFVEKEAKVEITTCLPTEESGGGQENLSKSAELV